VELKTLDLVTEEITSPFSNSSKTADSSLMTLVFNMKLALPKVPKDHAKEDLVNSNVQAPTLVEPVTPSNLWEDSVLKLPNSPTPLLLNMEKLMEFTK